MAADSALLGEATAHAAWIGVAGREEAEAALASKRVRKTSIFVVRLNVASEVCLSLRLRDGGFAHSRITRPTADAHGVSTLCDGRLRSAASLDALLHGPGGIGIGLPRPRAAVAPLLAPAAAVVVLPTTTSSSSSSAKAARGGNSSSSSSSSSSGGSGSGVRALSASAIPAAPGVRERKSPRRRATMLLPVSKHNTRYSPVLLTVVCNLARLFYQTATRCTFYYCIIIINLLYSVFLYCILYCIVIFSLCSRISTPHQLRTFDNNFNHNKSKTKRSVKIKKVVSKSSPRMTAARRKSQCRGKSYLRAREL